MADHEVEFEFERDLQTEFRDEQSRPPPQLPVGEIGQQPRNFVRNYKKTVCAFWIKGMCMKGDNCGFLHEMVADRMPECSSFLKKGFCNDPDCKFKHSRENIKECNMYALGFCIFGPECRYNHTRKPGPPPDPSVVEAAKPKHFRDINRVVNAVNEDVASDTHGHLKRARIQDAATPLSLPNFPAQSSHSGPPQSHTAPPRPSGGPPPGSLPPHPPPIAPRPPAPMGGASIGNPRPMPPRGPRPPGGMHGPPMGFPGPGMGQGQQYGAGQAGPPFAGAGHMRPGWPGGPGNFHRRPQHGMF